MYEIIVKEITERGALTDGYNREDSKEVYSQRVESLNLKAVIGAVNMMMDRTDWLASNDVTPLRDHK